MKVVKDLLLNNNFIVDYLFINLLFCIVLKDLGISVKVLLMQMDIMLGNHAEMIDSFCNETAK